MTIGIKTQTLVAFTAGVDIDNAIQIIVAGNDKGYRVEPVNFPFPETAKLIASTPH